MVSIDLNYNNAYKWTKKDKIYSIGYIFYNNKFYQGNQINGNSLVSSILLIKYRLLITIIIILV